MEIAVQIKIARVIVAFKIHLMSVINAILIVDTLPMHVDDVYHVGLSYLIAINVCLLQMEALVVVLASMDIPGILPLLLAKEIHQEEMEKKKEKKKVVILVPPCLGALPVSGMSIIVIAHSAIPMLDLH